MASKKIIPAKTIRRNEASVLKKVKSPKVVVKTTLENPFALAWPVISEGLEKEVISVLESCCSNLKIASLKPPWKDINKLRGKERVMYRQKYRETSLEKLRSNADAAERYDLAKEARSHLIFGYNAVMRALEQNKLAGIIIRKDVTPSLLVQTFLPGCIHKQIPLVALAGLPELLKKEDTLALKHRVMVLGLKLSVQGASCRFYPLYKSMLKVLEGMNQNHEQLEQHAEYLHCDKENDSGNAENMDVTVIGDREASKESATSIQHNLKEDSKSTPRTQGLDVSKCTITPEEVTTYHLKRSEKCRRVFVPVKKKLTVSHQEEDVISLESSKVKSVPEENVELVRKSEEDKKSAVKADAGFDFEFFIDTTGNEDVTESKNEESRYGKGSKNSSYFVSQDVLGLEPTKARSAPKKEKKDSGKWSDMFRGAEERKEIKKTIGTGFQFGFQNAGSSQFQFGFSTPENKEKDILRDEEGSTKEMRTEEGDTEESHKKNDQVYGADDSPKKKKLKVSSDDTHTLTHTYIPAKTKRIKSNPSRKGNKKTN